MNQHHTLTATSPATSPMSTRSRRSVFGRLAKHATASALAATIGLAVVSVNETKTAEALPIRCCLTGGGDDLIIIDPPTGHGGVTGTVDLDGCVTNPGNLRVTVSNTGFSGLATISSNGDGTYVYSVGGLFSTSYQVRASLPAGVCPFGQWSSLFESLAATDNLMVTGPTMRYDLPSKLTRVPGFVIAGAARVKAGDLAIKLDNLGPQNGASRFLANNSSATVAGQTRTFSLPEVRVDIDPCGICPDFGDGRFYVRDFRSDGVSFSWDRGLRIGVSFETSDREIKGYFTAPGTSSSVDSLMPDVEISSPRLEVTMVPVVNGSGGIKLVPSGSAAFTASAQATGGCSISAVDVCSWISGYKTKIKDAASQGATSALNSGSVQAAISSQIRSALNQFGIGTVRGVFLDGDDVIIAE